MIPPAHGGHLVHRLRPASELERREAEFKDLLRISPHIDQVYDAEKVGIGAYSPLEGFQDASSVASVMATGRLPNDLVWPMPIVLTPTGPDNDAVVRRARPGDEIGLVDPRGRLFALLHLEEKAPFPRTEVARTIYATIDPNHPNVADLLVTGETALSGKVDLLRRLDLPTGPLELTPRRPGPNLPDEAGRALPATKPGTFLIPPTSTSSAAPSNGTISMAFSCTRCSAVSRRETTDPR